MNVLKSKKTKRIQREKISVFSAVLKYIRKDDHAVKSGLYLTPFFLLTGLILILFLKYEIRLPKEGFPAEKSYYALDDFYYVDPDLTTIEKQKAARKVLPVYEFDVEAYEDLLGRTRMIFEALVHGNIEAAKDVFSWPKAGSVYQFYVDRAVDKQEVLIESFAIISRYLNRYLVSSKNFDSLESEGFYFLTVSRKDSEEKSVRLSDIHVIDSERLRRSLQDDIAYFLPDERKIRATLLQIYIHVLSKPTLNFDAALTETKRKSQADIQADVTKLVKKGSLILERGTNVTALHLRQLKSMGSGLEILNKNQKAFSMIVLFLFHSYLFCLFMIMFCRGRDVFTPHFLLTTGIMYLLANMGIKISYYFPGFVLIIPLVISILFFAILGETLLGVLFTMALVINIPVIYAPISIPLTPFLIGALFSAVFAHNIMKRSQLLRVGVFTGLVYFLAFFLFDVMYETREINEAVRYAGTMAFGGFISSLLVMGVLPLFEHFFHLSSNVQLLELSDLNHPLLRRLLREAPGTYHHSLMVGALAESAADAIGANALLARVGAYYHDIGKMVNPAYFTENEMGRKGKHENLTPSMSSLIVIAHIKDGMEIGKKYKLSQKIMDIIQQHHGTSLISYFYHKALEQTKEKEPEGIEEYSFRYPGPKPNTKEAAIVMIADSSEAASRALDEPTSSRIKGLVSQIVNDKILDRQFDESQLTFRDISAITHSVMTSLNGMFHFRVEYPQGEPGRDKGREKAKEKDKEENKKRETEVYLKDTGYQQAKQNSNS